MARRRRETTPDPAPRSPWRPDLARLLYLVTIGAAVVLPGDATFRFLGPWLESLGGAQRAGVGALVGALAASPWAVRLLPRIGRLPRILTQAWVAGAGAWVLTVWLPPKSHHGTGIHEGLFRARAEWYIPLSVAAFLAVLVLVEVAAFRAEGRRAAALHEQHMAAVAREVAAGRRRRGR